MNKTIATIGTGIILVAGGMGIALSLPVGASEDVLTPTETSVVIDSITTQMELVVSQIQIAENYRDTLPELYAQRDELQSTLNKLK